MSGLPSAYATMATVITATTDGDLSLDDILPKLLTVEHNEQKTERPSEEALMANAQDRHAGPGRPSNHPGGKSKGPCFHCGILGHHKFECRKLAQERSQQQQQPGRPAAPTPPAAAPAPAVCRCHCPALSLLAVLQPWAGCHPGSAGPPCLGPPSSGRGGVLNTRWSSHNRISRRSHNISRSSCSTSQGSDSSQRWVLAWCILPPYSRLLCSARPLPAEGGHHHHLWPRRHWQSHHCRAVLLHTPNGPFILRTCCTSQAPPSNCSPCGKPRGVA